MLNRLALLAVVALVRSIFVSAYAPPPSTAAARLKAKVDPRRRNLLGGGSAETAGHGLPMQEQPFSNPVAELAETPSWEVFYKEYIRSNTPVVLRGHTARLQPAFKLWTDAYLIEQWGSKKITAEIWKNEDRDGPREDMSLEQLIKKMQLPQHKNEYYAVIDFDRDTKAKAQFILPEPVRCKEVLPQSLTLWMSTGGTTSVLHHDDGENFLMLLDGTKEVFLAHQDHAQNVYTHAAKHGGTSAVHQDAVDHINFPNFRHVNWTKAVLQKGDTLYIPHSYWHQVNSKGRNLAANFWFGHKKDYHWWNPNDFDIAQFGTKGATPFSDLKRRGPELLPCTPLTEGETLDKKKFVDEGEYKQHLSKQFKKLQAKQAKHADL